MHYKAEEVKNMKAAEIRQVLGQYIVDVLPKAYGKVIAEELLTAIRNKSMEQSVEAKLFMAAEREIAEQTGDYRIHDMIQYLRQVDRQVKKHKTI